MIPIDKQYHFFAGFIIYLLSQFFFNTWFALVPVLAIATLKEIYDYISKKGTPDTNDLLFTIYGSIPILIFKLLLL